MKDYTEDIIVDGNTFRLILDETITNEFCLINKYAGIIEIAVHPLIVKIFNTDDLINFGAWMFLESCGTPIDDLEEFIRQKLTAETFIAMISSYKIFPDIFPVMQAIDRIHNSSEVIRDNKYNLMKSHGLDMLKPMMLRDLQESNSPSWRSKSFISEESQN